MAEKLACQGDELWMNPDYGEKFYLRVGELAQIWNVRVREWEPEFRELAEKTRSRRNKTGPGHSLLQSICSLRIDIEIGARSLCVERWTCG